MPVKNGALVRLLEGAGVLEEGVLVVRSIDVLGRHLSANVTEACAADGAIIGANIDWFCGWVVECAVDEPRPGGSNPRLLCAHIAVIDQGNSVLTATRVWTTKDRSAPGHIGSPHLASAEKGETLFATFSEGVQQLLQRIIKWDGKSWEG